MYVILSLFYLKILPFYLEKHTAKSILTATKLRLEFTESSQLETDFEETLKMNDVG